MTDKIVIFSTCSSAEEAGRIARRLVEARLAACVTAVPGAQSTYHWKGAVEQSEEWLLVIKSNRDLFVQLKTQLQELHSYEVPEVIAVPIVDGAESYLNWMDREMAVQE
jgi:periplasmic divalent cation tolerance protein